VADGSLETLPRSWLYAPGHSEKLLVRAFEVGADAVVLDLEDGVPEEQKARARGLVAEVVADRAAWVRINAAGSDAAAADLAAVAAAAAGIRIPKVESPADIAWVVERAEGRPLAATIESARGVMAAAEIAAAASVSVLGFGTADLALDLGVPPDSETLWWARCQVALASRAAGILAPVDGVYVGPDDQATLRREASRSRALGFAGKSAVRPWQVPILNAVFAATADEVAWAQQVLASFQVSGGAPTRLGSGELVDRPVVERARRIELAWAERVLARIEAAGGVPARLETGELIDRSAVDRAREILKARP
jgi:citrate lyase subunit beta/citryl-CoA lyase